MILQRSHLLALPLVALSCMSSQTPFGKPGMTRGEAAPFGKAADGVESHLFTLRNSNGLEVTITSLGATVVSVRVPDRDGAFEDVVLGFDGADGYLGDKNQYFGCTVGRVANRIEGGTFELEGMRYSLATNNPPNHLHGGTSGFGVRVWTRVEPHVPGSVSFKLVSEAGDEGYPGRVEALATYFLTDDDALGFHLQATSDAPTPVSMTNHAYWNLAGHGSETVLDHVLELRAEGYTPTDETLIPTGDVKSPTRALDFSTAKPIGRDIAALVDTPALGYDHNYVLFRDAPRRKESTVARYTRGAYDARLFEPTSGRGMELYTDQPGLQFYSGNFLFGQEGKDGATYALRSACCLEPQGIPDAINEPRFPSVVLRPGATYEHTTVLRFFTE